MLGLSGTLSYAVLAYLYICVFVFVYLCMKHNISVDILGPRAFRKCMVCMVENSIKWYFGHGDDDDNDDDDNRVNLEQVCS